MPPAEQSASSPSSKSTQQLAPSRTRAAVKETRAGSIAVISDIHSNLHALESVFTECTLRGIERFYCLGDTVGYSAFPAECLQAIRMLKCPTLLGNHDECVGRGSSKGNLNYMARAGVEYSIQCLTKSARTWVSALPTVITEGGVTLVHASIDDPLGWDYIVDDGDAQRVLPLQTTPVCFYGHTHVPKLFAMRGKPDASVLGLDKFRLDPNGRYLINPGSVGQPRGGDDPRAQFLVFDSSELTVEFVRVEYNINAAAEAILKAGLPPMLAERLYRGI